MRAVLVATDFLKDLNGEFKTLEINTSIAFSMQGFMDYFKRTEFEEFLTTNSIDTIELIVNHSNHAITTDLDLTGQMSHFVQTFQIYYRETYTLIVHKVTDQSPIPSIDDAPNKLILRLSYDENALVDSTYCKDNFNFLKLLSDDDTNSIPKTYFNDGEGLSIDTMGDNFRNNGNHPNIIIKERFPTTNYTQYPKVMKIDTLEELTSLKNSLGNNEILQEFIFNPNDLLNGKMKTYRTINMLYGPTLSELQFTDTFVHTNKCAVDPIVDYSIDKTIEWWERPKYLQKVSVVGSDRAHLCTETPILLTDNTSVDPYTLSKDDIVKSQDVFGLPDNDSITFTQPITDVFTNTTDASTTINSIKKWNSPIFITNIVLSNGTIFKGLDESTILIEDSESNAKFKFFHELIVGDKIVTKSISNGTFQSFEITSKFYEFKVTNLTTIDVETEDVYCGVESGNEPNLFTIQHNPACICYDGDVGSCTSYKACIGDCPGICSTSYPICFGTVFEAGECLGQKL